MEQMSKQMQQAIYQTHIAPLIETDKSLHSYGTLLHLAQQGFVMNVGNKELDNARMYQKICKKLYANTKTKAEVADTFSHIIRQQQHNSVEKMNAVMRGKGDSTVTEFTDLMEDYKVNFEVFLRDVLTPVYLFAAKHYGKKIKSTDAKGHVLAGADRKVKVLNEVVLAFDGIDISVFMKEIDQDIRNAAAHHRWRLLDKEYIEINPTDKAGSEIVLTKKEVEDKLERIKKTLWSMRAGLFTYLENVSFEVTDAYYEDFTKKEVEDMATTIDEKVIEVSDFNWGDNSLSFKMKNKEQKRNPGGEIYSAAGSYDIVSCIERLCYADRVLGYLSQYLSYFTEKDGDFELRINLFLDTKELGDYIFTIQEIRDINDVIKDGKTPKAISHIEDFCNEKKLDRSLRVDVRSDTLVPLGERKKFVEVLKQHFGAIDVEFLTID